MCGMKNLEVFLLGTPLSFLIPTLSHHCIKTYTYRGSVAKKYDG
ncbi:hypothetical protein SAMN05428952_101448 [Nitrosomonas sp. Nm132]|nr:hypothetical protein SAMN05428952_101448 [Nitrosomonas sp. Nm132]